MNEPVVTCQKCGFLCRMVGVERVEVMEGFRAIPTTRSAIDSFPTYVPLCNAEAVKIDEEFRTSPESQTSPVKALELVITAPRTCKEFREYRPGISPEKLRASLDAEKARVAKIMNDLDLLRWQAAEQKEREIRQLAAKREDDATHRAWQERQDDKRRRDEYVRWAVSALAVAASSLLAFFGGRYFQTLDKQNERPQINSTK